MKTFLRILLALFILAALGAAGWVCRILWDENRRLLTEKAALDVERLRFATGKDSAEWELKSVLSDNALLQRDLLAMRAALEKAEVEVKRLQVEKLRLEGLLVEERQQNRVTLERVQKIAEEKIAVEKAKSKEVAPVRPRRAALLEDVGSLKDLLELTDKAPRRTK